MYFTCMDSLYVDRGRLWWPPLNCILFMQLPFYLYVRNKPFQFKIFAFVVLSATENAFFTCKGEFTGSLNNNICRPSARPSRRSPVILQRALSAARAVVMRHGA